MKTFNAFDFLSRFEGKDKLVIAHASPMKFECFSAIVPASRAKWFSNLGSNHLHDLTYNFGMMIGRSSNYTGAMEALEGRLLKVESIDDPAAYVASLETYFSFQSADIEGITLHTNNPSTPIVAGPTFSDFFTYNNEQLYSKDYQLIVIPTRYTIGVVAMLIPNDHKKITDLVEDYNWEIILDCKWFPGVVGDSITDAIAKLQSKCAKIPLTIPVLSALDKATKTLADATCDNYLAHFAAKHFDQFTNEQESKQ